MREVAFLIEERFDASPTLPHDGDLMARVRASAMPAPPPVEASEPMVQVIEPEPIEIDDREAMSAALAVVEPEPAPVPPSLRERVRFRVGGPDDAPEMREAEIAGLGGRGVSVLVCLDGQHDPGVDEGLRARGQPARSGESLAFRGVTEGLGIGQWSRPS